MFLLGNYHAVKAPVLRDIAASALLAMRLSARVPRALRWVKSTTYPTGHKASGELQTNPTIDPFFCGG